MDRFSWSDGILAADEQLLVQQNGVRIYDGDKKVRMLGSYNESLFLVL
jgi:hypothetical protein